jgi:hypothetical protein
MISKQNENGLTKIFSDSGKKILQLETKRVYSVAYELDNGTHYTYQEIE